MAKEYLAGMHLNAELVADGHNVVHRLANVYRTPDYRNKVGGVCFVFEYKNIIGAQPEMFYIYVKCSGKTAKYRVRSIKKEDCSLEEILPGDNFSSLGGRYQYNGEKNHLAEIDAGCCALSRTACLFQKVPLCRGTFFCVRVVGQN